MSVTQIDLDDEALADVMRIAAVHTKKEAVNLAMRDYVERFRRIEALPLARVGERLGLQGLGGRAGRREGPRDLIYFLVDSSAVWRLQRQPEPTEAWNSALLSGPSGRANRNEPSSADQRGMRTSSTR